DENELAFLHLPLLFVFVERTSFFNLYTHNLNIKCRSMAPLESGTNPFIRYHNSQAAAQKEGL
ncbi:MAG: hypothetical protein ACW975_08950, partial [Candidatus Thorarchaeota archaeon]